MQPIKVIHMAKKRDEKAQNKIGVIDFDSYFLSFHRYNLSKK